MLFTVLQQGEAVAMKTHVAHILAVLKQKTRGGEGRGGEGEKRREKASPENT